MSGDLEIDVYTVRLRLAFLVPEFLPIRGKRARVYYHGIPSFCVVCYSLGHQRTECYNNSVSWIDYTEALKRTGIPARLFDPILDFPFNVSTSTPIRGANASFQASLQALLQEYSGQGVQLNLSQNPVLQNQIQNQLQIEAQASPPVPNQINPNPVINRINPTLNPNPNQIDPTHRPVTRSRANGQLDNIVLPRGRGGRGRSSNNSRGSFHNQDPQVAQINQAQNNQAQNIQFDIAQNNRIYRGRGRGRTFNNSRPYSTRGQRRGQ